MARPAALGPMQATAARQMRRTAQLLDEDHPETVAGDHVRDAARVLEHGSHEGARRHLDAAMEVLTPRNLVRHGILDDDGHALAKHHLHQVNRHRLAVQDIEDTHARNQQLRSAARALRGEPEPPQPQQPGQGAIAAAGDHGIRVLDFRSDAWKLERRGPNGEWVGKGGVYHGGGAIPAVGYRGSPLGRKVSRREALGAADFFAHMKGYAPPEQRHKVPTAVGTKGSVFGRKLSAREALGASLALAPKPLSEYPKGLLPGQLDQFRSLSKPQKVIYKKLRARGRAHHGAYLIARTFQPGMLESAVLANRSLALELVGPKGYVHGWIKVDDAASLHGRTVVGRTAGGYRAGGIYNHQTRTVHPPRGGTPVRIAQVRRVPGSGIGYSGMPVNRIPRMGEMLRGGIFRKRAPAMTGGRSQLAGEVELVGPGGYVHGWVKVGGSGVFAPGMLPGSFEHIRAIDDLAARAGASPGDPAHASPTMRTALHNVAKAVGGRDMHRARVHLDMARWANLHEAGGLHTRELADLGRQLRAVPRGVTGWEGRVKNPLSHEGQHPGSFQSGTPSPPAHPAAGARKTSAIGYAGDQAAILLSARTALLERTPAPRGRPGGPGLYDVKGLGHTAYLQQIVKALIEKRGMPPGKAYAIARGAIRKWMRGGGHVHPEVRAAAGRAEAGELAKQARAHTHAISGWEVADVLIELAAEPIELFNPYHAPPGAGGGQFTTQQGGGQAKQKQQAARQDRRGDRAQRQALTHKIAGIRSQIAALQAQLPQPRKATRATKAKTAAAAAAAAKRATAAKSKTSTPRKKGPAKMSPATIHAKIAALRATLRADLAQLRSIH